MRETAQPLEIKKEAPLEAVFRRDGSPPRRKYQAIVVGHEGLRRLFFFELCATVMGPMSGALGLWLRKQCYPRLMGRLGSGVVWGRNVAIRHPDKIAVGDRVVIDDDCLLDARGSGATGVRIGSDVLIARGTIVQAKAGGITIGDHCIVGSQCQLSSVSGISLGRSVMVSGQCYIGGGRYQAERRGVPMKDQGLYSNGPIIIEDDVWLGAGVIVQDGVRIGQGSIVGAGAVVREDLPEFTVAVPQQRLLLLPRTTV